MAGTSDAAAKAGTKTASEKIHEKVADKRKALGRGLDSLLPGPRAVPAPPPTPVPVAAPAPAVAPAQAAAEVESGREYGEPTHRTERDEWGTRRNSYTSTDRDDPTSRKPRDVGHPDPGGDSEQVDLQAAHENWPYDDDPVQADDQSDTHEPVRHDSGLHGHNADPRSDGHAAAVPAVGMAIPEAASTPESIPDAAEVVQLDISLIDKNPHQTRRRFNEAALEELSQSIKVQGLLQPIVVRADGKGRFKLILGERRWRATGMAGLSTVPAIVKRVSEQQAAEMTLVENLQRQDLNCVEQADAFARLSQEFNMTQTEIGARVGMSRETVANYMRLLTLPSGVLEALVGGRLTFSHARVLLPLRDHAKIWSLAKRAIEERMTVQKLEDLVLGVPTKPGAPSQQGGARWVDPNVKAAQRSLEEILGMRVRIRDRHGRGRILIDYATVDDYQRVVAMLGGK